MAGGRNVPDIGVQHPSNQNMMQMNQVGNKGTIPIKGFKTEKLGLPKIGQNLVIFDCY